MINKKKIIYLEEEKERDMIEKKFEKNIEVKVIMIKKKESFSALFFLAPLYFVFQLSWIF